MRRRVLMFKAKVPEEKAAIIARELLRRLDSYPEQTANTRLPIMNNRRATASATAQ